MQSAAILTVHYCTVHYRVFVPSLNSWLSLSYPQVSAIFDEAPRMESACDYCMLTASNLLQQQFPLLFQ